MNPLDILKANFAANLEKQGSSLQELDKAFQKINEKKGAEQVAELLKKAFAGLDKINPIDIGGKTLGGYAGLVVGGGYVGANAIDSLDKSIDSDNKKLQSYKDKIHLLKKLTHKVQQENL